MPHYCNDDDDEMIKRTLLVQCLAFMFPGQDIDQVKLVNPFAPGYWQPSLAREMYRSAHGHMMLNAFAQGFDATFVDRHVYSNLLGVRSMGGAFSHKAWDSLEQIRRNTPA